MKEQKIISFIGIYGSLIMSSTSKTDLFSWLWIGSAIIWSIKFIYLKLK